MCPLLVAVVLRGVGVGALVVVVAPLAGVRVVVVVVVVGPVLLRVGVAVVGVPVHHPLTGRHVSSIVLTVWVWTSCPLVQSLFNYVSISMYKQISQRVSVESAHCVSGLGDAPVATDCSGLSR